MKDFFYNEEGDVNIVSMVVLIGIAVLLAVIFKNNIKDLLDVLFKAISGNAEKAVS
ncbi:MAG: Flp1 family type IVb pilin [[Ruminococcus] lactaris]